MELSGRLGRSVAALMKQVRCIEIQEGAERGLGEATAAEGGEEEDGEEGASGGGATTSTSTAERANSTVDGQHSSKSSATAAIVGQKRRAAEIEQPAPVAGRKIVGVKVEEDDYFHDTRNNNSTSSATVPAHLHGNAVPESTYSTVPNQDSVHADSLIWGIYTGGDMVGADGTLTELALAAVAAELRWPTHRVAARLEDLKVLRGHV